MIGEHVPANVFGNGSASIAAGDAACFFVTVPEKQHNSHWASWPQQHLDPPRTSHFAFAASPLYYYPMPYLLDTYNILHAAIPMGGQLSNLTVRSLCQWILASPQRIKATLVLDGRAKPDEPSPNEFPDLDLVYSGAGVSADKVISQLVERSRHRKKLTVVSNDRAVILHARHNGASAISSEAFLQLLMGAQKAHRRASQLQLPKSKTAGTASHGETDHWLKEFGLTAPPPKPQGPFIPPASSDDPDNLTDEDLKRLMGG